MPRDCICLDHRARPGQGVYEAEHGRAFAIRPPSDHQLTVELT